MGHNFNDFNKLFPSLCSLELDNVKIANPKAFQQHFPELRNLHLIQHEVPGESAKDNEWLLSESNVGDLLRLNPNINDLEIHGKSLNAKFMKNISEHLQTIKRLSISWDDIESFNLEDDVIHLKNVKRFSIQGWSQFMPSKFSFDKLKTLHLLRTNAAANNFFIDFIRMHPSIIRLVIDTNDQHLLVNREHILELASALPSLEKSTIYNKGFSIDEIITLINECKALKMVRLLRRWFSSQTDSEIHEMLNAQIGSSWKITFIYYGVDLERLNN